MSLVMKTCPHCRHEIPCVDGQEAETHHDWRGCVSSLATANAHLVKQLEEANKKLSLMEIKHRHATDKIEELIKATERIRKKVSA